MGYPFLRITLKVVPIPAPLGRGKGLDLSFANGRAHPPLIPAKAGIQSLTVRDTVWLWVPAFAGTSGEFRGGCLGEHSAHRFFPLKLMNKALKLIASVRIVFKHVKACASWRQQN